MAAIEQEPVYQEFMRDSVRPPSGDPFVAAFSTQFAHKLRSDNEFAEWYMQVVNRRRAKAPFTASHAAGMTLKLLQMNLMTEDAQYPVGYERTEAWKEPLDSIYESEKKRFDFDIYMEFFNLQTNVAERYMGALLVARYFGLDTLQVLDIGCSRNHGIAWMDMVTGRGVDGETAVRSTESWPDGDQTYNKAWQLADVLGVSQMEVEEGYGVDLWPLSDPLMAQWQKACRNPNELVDPAYNAQFERLEAHRDTHTKIHFVMGDFSQDITCGLPEFTRAEALPAPVDAKFNLIIFSTVLYQLTPEKRRLMIDNARHYLAPGGVIIVNDFSQLQSLDAVSHPSDQLTFPEHWRNQPYMYKTHAMREDESSFQTYISWRDGRCRDPRPEPALHVDQSSC